MEISCSTCSAAYRVKPEKVPPQGAVVKCLKCGTRIKVVRPSGLHPAEEEVSVEVAQAKASAETGSISTSVQKAQSDEVVEPHKIESSEKERVASANEVVAIKTSELPEMKSGVTTGNGIKQKARTLARALISDMVIYHPDEWRLALEAENLKEVFASEIKRSWQLYCEQIGLSTAKSTPFFRDALNEILANGQNVF